MPPVLNVCHVTTLTAWGGVETRLVEYLNHRQSPMLKHFVAAPKASDELAAAIRETGTPLLVSQSRHRNDPRVIWVIQRWMRQHQLHIVHSRNQMGNCVGGLAARMAAVPITIAGEHGTIRYPLKWKWWYEPWIDRTSDLVIANSESSRRLLEYKYRVPANRIQVIHNGVHIGMPERSAVEMRAELAIPEGVKIVGNVARLNTVKDHFTLIEAARVVLRQRDDVRFIIVGGGPLEDELRGLIHQYGLGDRFLLIGWRRDIVDFLQILDVFVSTSISEPLGGSIIEAMWSGVPVIAQAVDGVPEIVKPGETGILLQPTEPVRQPRSPGAEPMPALVLRNGTFGEPLSLNPRVLADTICKLLNQPSEGIVLANRAKQAVQSYFHIDRYVTELENTYLRLAQAKGIIESVSTVNP